MQQREPGRFAKKLERLGYVGRMTMLYIEHCPQGHALQTPKSLVGLVLEH